MTPNPKQELLDEVNLLDNAIAQMNLNRDTHIRMGMASNKIRQFIEAKFHEATQKAGNSVPAAEVPPAVNDK